MAMATQETDFSSRSSGSHATGIPMLVCLQLNFKDMTTVHTGNTHLHTTVNVSFSNFLAVTNKIRKINKFAFHVEKDHNINYLMLLNVWMMTLKQVRLVGVLRGDVSAVGSVSGAGLRAHYF